MARAAAECASSFCIFLCSIVSFASSLRLQVAEQGLTPDLALRACNNPAISNSALSRELAKVITVRAEEIVKTLRSSKTDDAAAEDLGGVIGAEVAVPSGASLTNKRRRAA